MLDAKRPAKSELVCRRAEVGRRNVVRSKLPVTFEIDCEELVFMASLKGDAETEDTLNKTVSQESRIAVARNKVESVKEP